MVARHKHTKKARKSSHTPTALNVRSANDITAALGLLKKAPVALVLVYANWCPHCHTYMPTWEKIAKTPGRNVPMIATEQATADKIMSQIYKNGAPMQVEGFPTVIAVGKASNGKNIGVEVPNSRNEVAMTNMVRNGSELAATVNSSAMAAANSAAAAQNTTGPSSPIRTSNLNNMANGTASPAIAETLGEDVYLAKEQTPEEIAATMEMPPVAEPSAMPLAANAQQKGGSLYESLAAFASPAAAATAGLIIANRMMKRRGVKATRRLLKSRGRRAFFKSRKGRYISRKYRKGRR